MTCHLFFKQLSNYYGADFMVLETMHICYVLYLQNIVAIVGHVALLQMQNGVEGDVCKGLGWRIFTILYKLMRQENKGKVGGVCRSSV